LDSGENELQFDELDCCKFSDPQYDSAFARRDALLRGPHATAA
jgi:hypothetical protein